MTHRSASPVDTWLPLKPEIFHLLLALSDGERHGYGIMKEVERATGGEVSLLPSPLYRRLKRLLDGGIIEEADERPDPELDDARRRYYRLTAVGRRLLAAEARRVVSLASRKKIKELAGSDPEPSSA